MLTIYRIANKSVSNGTIKRISNFGGKSGIVHSCLINATHNTVPEFVERYIDRKMSSPHSFRFTDYDCIGFDLDNTVARYKVGAMIEMEYEVMANFLVDHKGYSSKHLKQPFDHKFILKGLIVDDENGNILRIAPNGGILQASHGTRMLNDEEIEGYYPSRHWEAADLFAKDPLVTWNGPYSEKMRTLLDYFDISASLIFARAVDALDEQYGHAQAKYNIWPDLLATLQNMFERTHFALNKGDYFEHMKADPEKYYYKCSERFLNWLETLKRQGKMLFLLTGAHVDFASHTASNTLGPNWRKYFDIVVCFAKKPGFFTMKRDFLAVDGFQEIGPVKELAMGEIYTHGNWTELHEFFTKHINKPDPRFLYIGDNLIQDVYTPNVYSHCETVAVCEELEAEGIHGHQQWHPDMQFLISPVWGSYFHCNGTNTNWYDIMYKHSKVCVPSLEYVVTLPIDHEFKCNNACV